MADGFDKDPHSQNGHECPKNFFGITSYEELREVEAVYVGKRSIELRLKRQVGMFDTAHLREIHRALFQDVFPWAGEMRLVGISKVGGAPFANPQFIVAALSDLFANLRSENFLLQTSETQFATRAAYFLSEINAVHPFREGNGRTQREFIRQLALNAGYSLSWAGLDEQRNTASSIAAHVQGDLSGIVEIIQYAIADAKKAARD